MPFAPNVASLLIIIFWNVLLCFVMLRCLIDGVQAPLKSFQFMVDCIVSFGVARLSTTCIVSTPVDLLVPHREELFLSMQPLAQTLLC